jgi:hypothetical protein
MSNSEAKQQVSDVLFGTSESYIRVGSFLKFRQFGSSENFEVSSDAPGTDGNASIIVLKRDLLSFMNFMVELTETVFGEEVKKVRGESTIYNSVKPEEGDTIYNSVSEREPMPVVKPRRGRPRKVKEEIIEATD